MVVADLNDPVAPPGVVAEVEAVSGLLVFAAAVEFTATLVLSVSPVLMLLILALVPGREDFGGKGVTCVMPTVTVSMLGRG